MTYVSPFGKPEGIGARLADWAKRLSTDKTLSWPGLGIIEDLRLAGEMLGGPPSKLPLAEARAEVFAELAATGGPTGQRAPAAPVVDEPEEWEKALPVPAVEFDL